MLYGRGRGRRRELPRSRRLHHPASRSTPSRSATKRSSAAIRVNRDNDQGVRGHLDRSQRRCRSLEAKIRVAQRHRPARRRLRQSLTSHPTRPTRRPTAACSSSAASSLDGPYNPPPPPARTATSELMAHADGLEPARSRPRDRHPLRHPRLPPAGQAGRSRAHPGIYDLAEKEGERFEDRVRLALCRVLVSPHFLFRVELDPPGAKAGRALPDQRATSWPAGCRISSGARCPTTSCSRWPLKGELRQNLTAQVERMLKDPKSAAFVAELRRPVADAPQAGAGRRPTRSCSRSSTTTCARRCSRETELFFEAILREDRSILDLLDADFTLRQRPPGPALRHRRACRARSSAGCTTPANRGGLLTQASILTLTSNPTRTVAGQARQVGAGAAPGHAAAAAAARRARARRAEAS